MLSKRIIPCLDVHEGRVVKGIQFENLSDAGDPVEIAAHYDQSGADELVFLDISASHEERDTLLDTVRQTAQRIAMPLAVGGGVRTIDDFTRLLRAGADKICVNTAAFRTPEIISEASHRFGQQCVVIAIDARSKSDNSGWEVVIRGGREPTGVDVLEWAKEVERLGAGEILLTSMDRDGTRMGYDLELTRSVSQTLSIPIIASGGAGNLDHLFEVLSTGEADAALAASIFHFGDHAVRAAKEFLAAQGIAIRPVPPLP